MKFPNLSTKLFTLKIVICCTFTSLILFVEGNHNLFSHDDDWKPIVKAFPKTTTNIPKIQTKNNELGIKSENESPQSMAQNQRLWATRIPFYKNNAERRPYKKTERGHIGYNSKNKIRRLAQNHQINRGNKQNYMNNNVNVYSNPQTNNRNWQTSSEHKYRRPNMGDNGFRTSPWPKKTSDSFNNYNNGATLGGYGGSSISRLDPLDYLDYTESNSEEGTLEAALNSLWEHK